MLQCKAWFASHPLRLNPLLVCFFRIFIELNSKMNLPELHAKYLRDELLGSDEFKESIAYESVHGALWTLHRSYSVRSHNLEEHFDIKLLDQDHTPLVRCALKLVVPNNDATQDDAREKLFKPRIWFGPEMYVLIPFGHSSPLTLSREVEVRDQGHSLLPTRSTEEVPELSSHSVASIIQGPIDHEAARSERMESDVSSESDTFATQVPLGTNEQEKYSIPCMLNIAKAFLEGSRILVEKPRKGQSQRLASIRGCFVETNAVCLMDLWRQWKSEGVTTLDLCAKTQSHTRNIRQSAASIRNVGYYMTGITRHFSLGSTCNPAPSKQKNQTNWRYKRAIERILKLLSTFSARYGAVTIVIFTILEGMLPKAATMHLAHLSSWSL
jgi:hypothetical protein